MTDTDAGPDVTVAGRRLHVDVHGPLDGPGIVLLHGGDAHGGWWDLVVPVLAERFRVVVPDLSGYGRSDHGERYSFDGWADEAVGVAAAVGIGTRPVVIGHSQGGVTALVAARRHGAGLAGVVAVDASLRRWPTADLEPFRRRAERGHRVHSERGAALARFVLRPDAVAMTEPVRLALAERALGPVDGGWAWRSDPRTVTQEPIGPEDLGPARCPVALVVGEQGLTTPEMNRAVARALDREHLEVREIPGAGHHVPLDAPAALAAVLAGLVEGWTGAGLAGHPAT